ncbi:MAG TPA: AI-2E family transporter [Gemmatimonadales bacterium]|jgi:predicted PurR-regulated permease PerM|nr:AI-2E family transporter [Gemmatimonadales bacterium]
MSPGGPDRRGFPLTAALAAVLLIALLLKSADVLLLVFIAVVLGVYLRALADLLVSRARVPEAFGLAAALVVTLAALVGIVLLIAPAVAQQVHDLLANTPSFLTALDESITRLAQRFPLFRRSPAATEQPGILASSIGELLTALRGAVVPYLKSSLEVLIEGVSVFVMALYLARHPRIYTSGIVALTPPRHRPLALRILPDLGTTLRAWVIGQLTAMFILGLLTTLGLWLLGVPYFLAFGVFAGVAAIVPFFGTLVSTILPALFALSVAGVPKALLVAALGVLVHLIEANLVAPQVMERQVNLPPVLTIAGVLLMGRLFGTIGLLVAVPILAVIMVLLRHILLGEVYGDPVSALAPAGTVPPDAPRTVAPPIPPPNR